MHYIIFERNFGHCVIKLVQATSLRESLTLYAKKVYNVDANAEGFLKQKIGSKRVVYLHPLEFVEARCKATTKFDELEWSDEKEIPLNGSSWEIHQLPESAWQANFAEVFCSAEPWSLGEYISLCRPLLRQQHPYSRARAFVWYLKDGPLVTFYRRKNHDDLIEIVERYLIPWQQDLTITDFFTSAMVQRWQGTYDDLLAQMRLDYPF